MRIFVLTRLAAFTGAVAGAALLLFLLLDLLPQAGGTAPLPERLFGLATDGLGERLAVTLPLVLLALLLAGSAGLGLGLLSVRSAPWARTVVGAATTLLAVVPPFWLGMLLALLFAGVLKLLPANGFVPWSGSVGGALASLLLPALALALPHAGQLARRVQREFEAARDERALLERRMAGLGPREAEWQLGFARLLPLLPGLVARLFGSLLAAAALVEGVFYLPGLGRQVLGAAVQHDLPLLRGSLLALVLVAASGMLLLVLGRLLVDPALRPRWRP